MYPVLFKIGPLVIYSFGLMMAIAFLAANYFFAQEIKRRKWDERHVTIITMIALIGGVAGSKLFSIFEDWSAFMHDPVRTVFSASGLTFYGGFIVAALGILIYLRRKKLSFLAFADMIAPVVLLAYGIGRIGCQLAGDGDYGIPTKLPWGAYYSHGTAKPTYVLEDYFKRYPDDRIVWKYDSLKAIPAGIDAMGQSFNKFDEETPCHPTPVYETIVAVLCFVILWSKRKAYEAETGKLFGLTIFFMGAERFLVEFLRINPLYASLSMAQWISIGLVLAGSALFLRKK
ncbi:MAG: prolipoprotein diacylglyceryl transferase [Bacteroidota bacterium]|nr:prolipoprotein diacylglyceryl transferase [Bacteroidota bacterium]